MNPQIKVEMIPPMVERAYTLPLTSPAVSSESELMRMNKGEVQPKKNTGAMMSKQALMITAAVNGKYET